MAGPVRATPQGPAKAGKVIAPSSASRQHPGQVPCWGPGPALQVSPPADLARARVLGKDYHPQPCCTTGRSEPVRVAPPEAEGCLGTHRPHIAASAVILTSRTAAHLGRETAPTRTGRSLGRHRGLQSGEDHWVGTKYYVTASVIPLSPARPQPPASQIANVYELPCSQQTACLAAALQD